MTSEAATLALAKTHGERIGAGLVAKLRELDARLERAAGRVLAHETDEDAVHDLRVLLRRTRTVLELGRDVLGRFHCDEVRRALRDVHRATGALRDEEVLLALFDSLGVDRPDVAAWLEGRRSRERRLRRSLARLLRAGALEDGRHLLEALLAFRVEPSRDKRAPKFARRAVERARREVERRRGAARIEDADSLHRLRIAYKRLRYTVETFAESVPADLAALAPSAARMQARLGELHDVDVAIASVRRARALTDDGRAELLAALTRRRAERAAAYARDSGTPASPLPLRRTLPSRRGTDQPVGVVSLRKISTR